MLLRLTDENGRYRVQTALGSVLLCLLRAKRYQNRAFRVVVANAKYVETGRYVLFAKIGRDDKANACAED